MSDNNIIKFDAEMFDGLLEVAANSNTSGGGKYTKKPRQNFIKHPGIRFSVSNAPAGGLAYSRPNKKGVLMPKTAREVRAVVLDSMFSMAQWGKDEGKPKMMCSSISHTNLNGTPGTGAWQVPLKANTLADKLNPQGFKGMSCGDCIASKGNEGCKQSGAIHVLITGLDHGETDPETDDYIGIQDCEPFIAHISTSGMSAFQYSDFLQEVRRMPNKPNPDSVQAIFSTQDNPRAPVKMLKIDINKPYADSEVARKLLAEELDRLAADEAKRLEEWKAKNGITSKAAPSKSKPADGEDELPF